MQGVAFLLVMCTGALVAFAVTVVARASREHDERAGIYGRGARERRARADEEASMIASIVALHETGQLADMVAELDRLAWSGVPVSRVERVAPAGSWQLRFRDGTLLSTRTEDQRAMRRAGLLARRDALVVARVLPVDDAAVVSLSTPRHAPLRVSLRA